MQPGSAASTGPSARLRNVSSANSFAQSLGAVFKPQLTAIWVIQEHLAP